MCAVSAIAELAWHIRCGIFDTFPRGAAGQRIRFKRPGWLVQSMSCGGSLPYERRGDRTSAIHPRFASSIPRNSSSGAWADPQAHKPGKTYVWEGRKKESIASSSGVVSSKAHGEA